MRVGVINSDPELFNRFLADPDPHHWKSRDFFNTLGYSPLCSAKTLPPIPPVLKEREDRINTDKTIINYTSNS